MLLRRSGGPALSVEAAVAAGANLSSCIQSLEHLGAVSYGHVGFRGMDFFTVERYAARILRAAAWGATST